MTSRPSPSVLQIYIFRDGEFLGTDIFAEREVVIGRDPDEADLVLESGEVSRAHALITVTGSEITVEDQGSTNGILVNDEQVAAAKVTRLDEISIGEFTLKCKLSGGRRAAKKQDRTQAQPSLREAPGAAEVASPRVVAAAVDAQPTPKKRAAKRKGAKKSAAKKKGESPQILARADNSAPFNPNDLSDFDDIDERDQIKRPGPEFRSRLGPVDNNELGEMLEGMGLSEEQKAPMDERAEVLEGEVAPTSIDLDIPDPADPNPLGRPSLLGNVARRFKNKNAAASVVEAPSTVNEESLEGGPAVPRKEPEPELDENGEPVAELAAFAEDDLDEDELEDLNYVPSYSLAEKLVSEDAMVAAGSRDAPYQVEVLTLKGESVTDVALLKPGQSYWVGPKHSGLRRPKDLPARFRLAKFQRSGAAVIEVPKDVDGTLNRAGSDLPLAKVQNQPSRSQIKKGVVGLAMKPGEVLDVHSGSNRYHVRYARPPAKILDTRSAKDKFMPGIVTAYSGAGSLGAHFAAIIVLWIIGVASASKPVAPGDEFVEVSLEADLELEQEPEPEPEPVLEEEPAPEPEPQKAPEPEPKPRKKPKMRASKPNKTVKKEVAGGTSNKPAGVLGLLSKRGSSAAPGPASAVASLSNLKAAKVPGSKGGFKTSGLIGKTASSDLNLGGGGGGVSTKGALALLKGGKGGAGRIRGGAPSGKVRGMVSKAPARKIKAAGGTLGRDEIQKVINKNIGQIQRCYERELTKNAGLSGKVTIEWTVGTSGSVSVARQKQSSLNSTSAVNCMIGAIKRWKFPQPRGGPAIVTYPFNFRAVSG